MRARLFLLIFTLLTFGASATEIPSLPPFQPAFNYTALTASPAGVTAPLPTGGPQIVIYNQGDVDAIVTLGQSGIQPSALGEVVRAHGYLQLSVGQARTIAALTQSGSAPLLISAGSGALNAGGAGAGAANAANQTAVQSAPGSPASTAITVQGAPGGAALPASDLQSAPFAGVVAMTVGTTYAAQRSVGVLATVAGNVDFRLADSSTLTLPVYPGWQAFPFAVTQIVSSGTTATATYYNLK